MGHRILRVDEVVERVGVGRTTLWRWERAGRFPARRQLGDQSVGWLEAEVDAWIEGRPRVVPGSGTAPPSSA